MTTTIILYNQEAPSRFVRPTKDGEFNSESVAIDDFVDISLGQIRPATTLQTLPRDPDLAAAQAKLVFATYNLVRIAALKAVRGPLAVLVRLKTGI